MSFRAGNQGQEMWPDCLRLGVAAITYDPLSRTDLSQYPQFEPRALWNQMAVSQKVSLRRVAYEMQAGDVIYVKQGPKIVDKGIVKGPANQSAYEFDARFRIMDPYGVPWAHQVRVDWSGDFPETAILLGSEQYTVKKMSPEEVSRVESAAANSSERMNVPTQESQRAEALIEEAYYRESPATLKIITRRHNRLSNEFCQWLTKKYGIHAEQEREQVDIRFTRERRTVLVELKVCFGVGTTKSIREALGQVLEYNHYPTRNPADTWLIVLDDEPSATDKQFVELLRKDRRLPITVGWRTNVGFAFHSSWT